MEDSQLELIYTNKFISKQAVTQPQGQGDSNLTIINFQFDKFYTQIILYIHKYTSHSHQLKIKCLSHN